jgi:hypothetical protein
VPWECINLPEGGVRNVYSNRRGVEYEFHIGSYGCAPRYLEKDGGFHVEYSLPQ